MKGRLFIELQLQRAWTDLWSLMRGQVVGTIITLLASMLTAPLVAAITHADFNSVVLTVVATSLAGPVAVFVLAFLGFFARAPGHLHREALLSSHVHQKNEAFSFSLYPASTIAALFLASILSGFIFWLAAHIALLAALQLNEAQRRDLDQTRASAGRWEALAKKQAAPLDATTASAATSAPVVPPARPVSQLNPARPKELQPAIVLAAPPTLPPKVFPTFVPPPAPPEAAPRHLTVEQQRFLVAALSPLSPRVARSIIFYTPADSETLVFANDLQRAFIRAGLQPSIADQYPTSPSELGIMLEVEKDTPKDLVATVKAIFEKAGIAARIVQRPNQTTGAAIIVFIGPQPL